MPSLYVKQGYAIHWKFPGSAERLAASVTFSELNKFALQSNDNSLWLLTSIGPNVWSPITASGSVPPSFTQTFGALVSWLVNHNLGYEPNVQILSVGGSEIEAELVHTSVNQCVVYFSSAQSGRIRAF